MNQWLLICGGVLVMGSVLLTWIKFPYSGNVAGWEFPVQAIVPHIHEFSYGLIGVAVLILAFFLRNRFRRSFLFAAAILLTLWMLVPARITFHQHPLLRRLYEESQAVPAIKTFIGIYRPHKDHGVQETPKHFEVVTLPGRFRAALSVLVSGWYLYGIGAFLIACYGVSRARGSRLVNSLLVISLPVAVLIMIGVGPMVGLYYFDRGAADQAAGNAKQVIVDYRKAMKWDPCYTGGIEVYNLIGEMEMQAGVAEGSPERAISHAETLRAKGNYEAAISDLQAAAAKTNPVLAKAILHEAWRIRAELGMVRYQSGAVRDAVANWEQALAEDSKARPLKSQPSLLYVTPYIARGDYELGRYQAGLKAAMDWADITVDHGSQQADIYALAAACLAKLGREDEARHYSDLSRAVADK